MRFSNVRDLPGYHRFGGAEKRLNAELSHLSCPIEPYCDWLRKRGMEPQPDPVDRFVNECFFDHLEEFIAESRADNGGQDA